MTEDVKRTNAEIVQIQEGLSAFQQVCMMLAGTDQAAAQRAMDIARLNAAYIAAIGVYRQAQEMLVAEFGEPRPGGQGFVITDFSSYQPALEALAQATQLVPSDVIEITTGDLMNLQGRPDVLAKLSPIAALVLAGDPPD